MRMKGEGGGLKSQKFCGRHIKWKPPYIPGKTTEREGKIYTNRVQKHLQSDPSVQQNGGKVGPELKTRKNIGDLEMGDDMSLITI